MAQFIGIEVLNVDKVARWLVELPTIALDTAADAILDYWRGVLRNPANYSAYRYISRAEAYPDSVNDPRWRVPNADGSMPKPVPGYFSPAQHRYVMARLSKGEINIPYQRTNRLATSWDKVGEGVNGFLVNSAPYASYVIDPAGQSRHEQRVGWWTAPGPLTEPARIRQAERQADAAIEKRARQTAP